MKKMTKYEGSEKVNASSTNDEAPALLVDSHFSKDKSVVMENIPH